MPCDNIQFWLFYVLEMLVRIPGNAPVGQWSVSVATWYGDKSMNESRHDMETFHATSTDPFYVLFNPFSESMFFHLIIFYMIKNILLIFKRTGCVIKH